MSAMPARPELITQAAYAELRGVSKQAIGKHVKSGLIPLIDGKIDPQIADMKLATQLNPARAKSLTGMGGDAGAQAPLAPAQRGSAPSDAGNAPVVVDLNTYAGARAAREKSEALRAQLAYEKLLGAVVDRDSVQRAAADVGRALRDTLMGAAVRIGPGLVGITDPAEAVRRVEAEMRRALDAAAQSIASALDKLQV